MHVRIPVGGGNEHQIADRFDRILVDDFIGGEPVIVRMVVVGRLAIYSIEVDQAMVPKGIAQKAELLIVSTGLPGEQLFFEREFEQGVPDYV